MMNRLAATILLVGSLSVCAHAETRKLALYLRHPERLNADSSETMRSELTRLFNPAGIEVVWKDFANRKGGEDFDFIAVGSIEGSCAPVDANPIGGVSLADAALSANLILPYFKVDCPHLMRMLGNESTPAMAGRALARVMGHELYHILARTSRHPAAGVAKAAFSINDLIMPGLDFDPDSLLDLAIGLHTMAAVSCLKDTRLAHDSFALRLDARCDVVRIALSQFHKEKLDG